jgi:hypothetical protein
MKIHRDLLRDGQGSQGDDGRELSRAATSVGPWQARKPFKECSGGRVMSFGRVALSS